jgi:hypothetical protein
MNPFAAFPGIVELRNDPLGAPVLIALVVVATWYVVSIVERGNRTDHDETSNGHDRSPGWW